MAHDLNELKQELYATFNNSTNQAKGNVEFREWAELKKVAAQTALAIAAVEHEITDATQLKPTGATPASFKLPIYHPPKG